MKLYFKGNLSVMNIVSIAAIHGAQSIFRKDPNYVPDKENNAISIEFDGEEYSSESIQNYIDLIAPLGGIANGEINYSGEYGGRFVIRNNEIEDLSPEACAILDASDDLLIAELEYRGYRVTKISKEKRNG